MMGSVDMDFHVKRKLKGLKENKAMTDDPLFFLLSWKLKEEKQW